MSVSIIISRYMDERLFEVLGKKSLVSVNGHGKIFFLIISVGDGRHIAMYAEYRKRTTLREMCAGAVADILRELDNEHRLDELEMPDTLVEDVEKCMLEDS